MIFQPGRVGGIGIKEASLHPEMLAADHAAEPREVALNQIGVRAAVAVGLGMVDPAHLEVGFEQIPMRDLVSRDDAAGGDPLPGECPVFCV